MALQCFLAVNLNTGSWMFSNS